MKREILGWAMFRISFVRTLGLVNIWIVLIVAVPISTFISATLIWIAFNYSALPDAWQRSRNIAAKMWAPRRRELDLHV